VRNVKVVFALHKPRRSSALAQVTELAVLAFDSWLAPLPQGVRSSPTGADVARQMLYRVGSFVVDLKLEAHAGNRVVLVGQVLNLGREGAGAPPVRVVLERGRSILAAAVANEFGEFVLEYEERGEMRLRVEVLGQRPLLIPLELAVPAPSEAPPAEIRSSVL
jgi:hypothetical protein